MNHEEALNASSRAQQLVPRKKLLWKIEELWDQYYRPTPSSLSIDTSLNYDEEGRSRYHPRFQIVDQFSFEPSTEPVFHDDQGSYLGLVDCQLRTTRDRPVYLVDNHNEILYPLMEIKEATGKTYDIVHVDAHPDDAEFQRIKPSTITLEKCDKQGLSHTEVNIIGLIQETRISDFFDAVSEANVIRNIFRVCHSDSFEFFLPLDEPYILSLDIDIFGPEGDFTDLESKVRVIAQAWGRADAVVIATSPGFIEQEFAKEIVEIFTK